MQPLPRQFWRRFEKIFPEKITLLLRNGLVFEGFSKKSERKFIGFVKVTESNLVKHNDTLLFIYYGLGKFEVLVFDKSDVENYLHEDSDSSGML